jgi:hypothetical protein
MILCARAAAGALTGCGAGERPPATVSDSAGVRIVLNHSREAWRQGTAWTATVDLTIGADSGHEAYQFGRIGDLAITPRGDIAVIDQLAGTVRVFDREGTFVRSVGRPGRGPGELSRSANGIFPLGGVSLVGADPGERRLTVYAPDGAGANTIALPAPPHAQGWARRPDGKRGLRGRASSRADGKFVFWDALLSMTADGTATDTLFEFDYVKSDLGGPGRLRMQLIVNNPSWARLDDGRIAWTALDRDYLSIHAPDGRLLSRIRHEAWVTRPVTPDDKAAMVELLRAKLRMIGGDASFADSPQVEAPPNFPAITTVRAGPDGTIWVQQMGAVGTIDPMAINAPDRADFLGGSTWHVLDRDGVFLGAIELPPRFRIFRMAGDAIHGAARDTNDVERIVRLRLNR